MIIVKLFGGAKKSFESEQFQVDKTDISIQDLLKILSDLQPPNFTKLDTENILIAINGTDSSAMKGRSTIIKNNDVVSIIPLIHGGSSKRIFFDILKKNIQIIEIKGQSDIDVKFLESIRQKYSKIKFQAVSSKFILNQYHLQKILFLSLESEKQNLLLSNKLETDILMRFAITNQISDAIQNVGIKQKNNFILITIGNKKLLNSLYEEISPLCITPFTKNNEKFIKQHFKITKKQLELIHSKYPLEDILLEKAAILL